MKKHANELTVNHGCELCAKVSCKYRGLTSAKHVPDNGKYNCNTSKNYKG